MKPYYDRGGISIYHGDCREVLPEIGRYGLLLTDPPYGRAYATNRTVRGVGATWLGQSIAGDKSTALRDEIIKWAGAMPMLIFGSWKLPRPTGTRHVLIWDKGPASGMGDLSFPWKGSYEEIYVLGEGWNGHRDESVLKGFGIITWESLGRSHPTEKPVALLRYLIAKAPSVSPILDPFMGSGTSLRAAADCGRDAIGIEIEERYCEIAAKRLQQDVLPLEASV